MDLLLAFALLTSEAEPPPLVGTLAPSLRAVALQMELMDAQEESYLFHKPDDAACDWNILRGRVAQLSDAPPVSDAARFPPADVAAEACVFNRAYRGILAARLPVDLHRERELTDAIADADRLYAVWSLVREANSEGFYVSSRRSALKELHALLGPEAYHNARLPAPVPSWRFQSADR